MYLREQFWRIIQQTENSQIDLARAEALNHLKIAINTPSWRHLIFDDYSVITEKILILQNEKHKIYGRLYT